MKNFIIFLVRKRLGLKLRQPFRFKNQKSRDDYYFFDEDQLTKAVYRPKYEKWFSLCYDYIPSHVSLNWILSGSCEIIKYPPKCIPNAMKDPI